MDKFGIIDNVITTPLGNAARNGEIEVLRQLLVKGFHVNLNNNCGWTPLHEAVANNHLDCAELVLQHDECDENARTYDGMSAMFVACQYQNNVDLIKLLVEYGVSCNQGNHENVTPLHVASKLYKLDLVKELLKHGATVNAMDFNKFTPLMEAIDQDDKNRAALEVIHFLLKNGSEVSLTDLFGRTAFFIAVCGQWNECVNLLLQCGSNVNARAKDGGTALMVAAQSGNLSLVKLLLESGAATDIMCEKGTFALHYALHNGFISVAEELIRKMDMKEILGGKKGKFESFLLLAIDSGSFESFKFVMNNKLYSHLDHSPISSEMLSHGCFRHYLYETPLSFLLYQQIEEVHAMPILKWLLVSGEFSVNARDQDFIPPLVALIFALFRETNKVHVNQIKLECFLKLLESGADIDYNTVKNCPGLLQIPDAVLAVIIPNKCSVSHSLLLPVLAHCFMCDWDDLLDWLIKYKICNAAVLRVLFKLGTKSKQSLLKVWMKVKRCSCHTCKKEFPFVEELINEREVSLQSLCRTEVRRWLWQKTGNSNKAAKLLHKMCIPLLVKQYIIPVKI